MLAPVRSPEEGEKGLHSPCSWSLPGCKRPHASKALLCHPASREGTLRHAPVTRPLVCKTWAWEAETQSFPMQFTTWPLASWASGSVTGAYASPGTEPLPRAGQSTQRPPGSTPADLIGTSTVRQRDLCPGKRSGKSRRCQGGKTPERRVLAGTHHEGQRLRCWGAAFTEALGADCIPHTLRALRRGDTKETEGVFLPGRKLVSYL